MEFLKKRVPWKPRSHDSFNGDLKTEGASEADEKPSNAPPADGEEEEDDFIYKRLKELRRNSFMVLIPEEGEEEDDVEEEPSTNTYEWRDVEAEGRQWWGGFDALFEKYCDRMVFFDRMLADHVKESSISHRVEVSNRKSKHRFSCISMKKMMESEEGELLEHTRGHASHDAETAYVAHLALAWEALHCQYTQLCKKLAFDQGTDTCYNLTAQLYQQFHVLLQRFIENEPFEQGGRVEFYARSRIAFPNLLQVPNIKGNAREESDLVTAEDLLRVLETSVLNFYVFVRTEKRQHGSGHLHRDLIQIQSTAEKKKMKLKEMCRKSGGWKKESWRRIGSNMEVLFALIDMEVISRVLRTMTITKEQILWCEEKMKKMEFADGRLRRDPSPILFPC